ncbi:MAG: ribonuclease HII, partial [bacterium]|nr:ribonuclease HII [bacterium]
MEKIVATFLFMPRQLSFADRLIPPESEEERAVRMQRYERIAYQEGAEHVAGVDEAGRGCLAGPVVAAAVILPQGISLPEVNDSKQLTERQREALFPQIREQALSVGVGVMSSETVDQVNILQATYLAMEQAIANLTLKPDYLLLDAVNLVRVPIRQ